MDMEVTFMPALSTSIAKEDETTLQKYQRKMKEKKKMNLGKARARASVRTIGDEHNKSEDDFFGGSSDGEYRDDSEGPKRHGREKTRKDGKGQKTKSEVATRNLSTREELSLVAADDPNSHPKHFNMKAVLKAEKKGRKRGSRRRGTGDEAEENEVQENFAIDVKDERFKALHDDYSFAIDPSNPQYVFPCTVFWSGTQFCSTIVSKRPNRCLRC